MRGKGKEERHFWVATAEAGYNSLNHRFAGYFLLFLAVCITTQLEEN